MKVDIKDYELMKDMAYDNREKFQMLLAKMLLIKEGESTLKEMYYDLVEKYQRKNQECEELKKEINGYKTIIEKIRQEVQEDATCWSRTCYSDSYEECIECLKTTILDIIYDERNDFVLGRVICKECGKYKKALDEVEKLCKDHPFCDCSCGQDILDIINKAKDGR